MKITKHKLIFWAPRVLVILFAVFISIFAFDVFDQGYSTGELLIALSMHLIPTLIIVAVLALAWRWEWVGTVLFIALGIGYYFMTSGRFPWTTYLLMSGPLFLMGLLFLASWRIRVNARSR